MSTAHVGRAPVAGRILVGVDGSPGSTEALRWAVSQARLARQEVEALIAWDYPATGDVAPGDAVDLGETAADILRSAVEDAVGRRTAGRIKQMVVRGRGSETLVDASRRAVLLVVGRGGHGALAGRLLGPVAQRVVTHAACPVVVVPARR